MPFLEVSTLKDINVKETFLTVAKGILRIKFPEKYKKFYIRILEYFKKKENGRGKRKNFIKNSSS